MLVFSTRRQLLFSLATVLLTLSLIVGCSTSLAPSSTDQADDASANDPPASVTTLLSTTPESGEVLQVAGEAHTFTLRFDGPIKIAEGTLTAAADGHTETFDWTQVAALTGTNTNDITVTLPDRLVGDAPYTFTLNGGVNDENGSGIDLSDTALRFTTPPGRAGPVQNLQAIVGDAAAEIRFQAPIHDGGHEVTGYNI